LEVEPTSYSVRGFLTDISLLEASLFLIFEFTAEEDDQHEEPGVKA